MSQTQENKGLKKIIKKQIAFNLLVQSCLLFSMPLIENKVVSPRMEISNHNAKLYCLEQLPPYDLVALEGKL